MERLNAEGIFRRDLALTLRDRRAVMIARRFDTCILCRHHKVNEAGLCEMCYGMLDGEEFRLAESWLSGKGP